MAVVAPISPISPDYTRQLLDRLQLERSQLERAQLERSQLARLQAEQADTNALAEAAANQLAGQAEDPLAAQPQVDPQGLLQQAANDPNLLSERLADEQRAALVDAALMRDDSIQVNQQVTANDEAERLAIQQTEAARIDAQAVARIETQRIDADRAAQRVGADQLLASRVQQDGVSRVEVKRVENDRVEAQRVDQVATDRLQTQRLDEERQTQSLVVDEATARLQRERQADQIFAERTRTEGLHTYQTESERVVAETSAARLEAEQSISQQLQAARDRIDQLDATRIDQVDVSTNALVRPGTSTIG
jgi:hypothetical protein